MLGRIVLSGVVLAALAIAPAVAGPMRLPFGLLGRLCPHSAIATQCAYQIVDGNRNTAITEQSTRRHGSHHSSQFALTFQLGDDNRAYTGQIGKDQFSATIQVGNENGAFTYQEGKDQLALTVEIGDGQWSATSSIGDNTATSVVLTSF